MKAKLLKKLRKKFRIEYYPYIKRYKVYGHNQDDFFSMTQYFKTKEEAIEYSSCLILNYGRKYYEKYAKHISIKLKQ